MPAANECGFAHIAFAVDDVDQALEAAGGSTVGDIATTQIDGVGVPSAWSTREIPKGISLNYRSGVEPSMERKRRQSAS